MKITVDNLLIKKPSRYFYTATLICLIFLIFVGDTTWRHIDDYEPLNAFFVADSIQDYFKRFAYGWGTYPPIWASFTFSSYIFKFLGLDVVKFFCFLFGFISLTISSILTYSICLFIKNLNRLENNIGKNYNLEIFSILANILNPEILLHSNSNMPYNLSTITIQLIILLIINFVKVDKKNNNFDEYIILKSNHFILFTIFSILLTFQSTIIITGLFLTLFVYIYTNKIKIKFNYIFNPIFIFDSYKNLFIDIKNKHLRNIICISFLLLILSYISKLFLIVFYFQRDPGSWSNGINDIYNISKVVYAPSIFLSKIIFNFKSILTQSIYPYRFFQIQVSIFILILFLYSFFCVARKNSAGYYFSIFTVFTILITILLSSFGNFTFAPTRHTIFLYPLFWIPLILNLDFLLNKYRYKILINMFWILLSFYFAFGCFLSIKAISYSKNDNDRLLKLIENSDYYINKSYDPYSDLSYNGTFEYNLKKEKICSPEKIIKSDRYKVLVYSHRFPFIGEKSQLMAFFANSKGCFAKNNRFSILDKIEKKNIKDIEQNNFIFNGGSSLYAYLIEVRKTN